VERAEREREALRERADKLPAAEEAAAAAERAAVGLREELARLRARGEEDALSASARLGDAGRVSSPPASRPASPSGSVSEMQMQQRVRIEQGGGDRPPSVREGGWPPAR
jgi:hypothetical protein